jgi:hypothetical protein
MIDFGATTTFRIDPNLFLPVETGSREAPSTRSRTEWLMPFAIT